MAPPSPFLPDWLRLLVVGLVIATHVHLLTMSHTSVLVRSPSLHCGTEQPLIHGDDPLLRRSLRSIHENRRTSTTLNLAQNNTTTRTSSSNHTTNETKMLLTSNNDTHQTTTTTTKKRATRRKGTKQPKKTTKAKKQPKKMTTVQPLATPSDNHNNNNNHTVHNTTNNNTTNNNNTVHVMFGLHGNKKGFLDEWLVALKSVLLNAPLDAPLHVHLLTNAQAHQAVQQRLTAIPQLIGRSVWRNRITITSYNVEAYHEQWQAQLTEAARGTLLDARVGMGGYYRLFAHEILPPTTGPVFYMDTDSVVLSNLAHLWQFVDRNVMMQVSAHWICSAGIVINMEQAADFWKLLQQVPKVDHASDQRLLVLVHKHFPDRFGVLPNEWDTHMGHGYRNSPHKLLTKQQNGTGMLHFHGPRPTFFAHGITDYYCHRASGCQGHSNHKRNVAQTWGLAEYYVQLPWEWAMFMGRSMMGGAMEQPTGYPLEFQQVVVSPPPPPLPPQVTTSSS